MNNDKDTLRLQTEQRFRLAKIKEGLRRIKNDPKWRFIFTISFIAFFILIVGKVITAKYNPCIESYANVVNVTCLSFTSLALMVYFFGKAPNDKEIYNDFIRIGLVNAVGEAPVLISQTNDKNGTSMLVFKSKGFPLSAWEKRKEDVETALNRIVISFLEGDDKRTVIAHCAPKGATLPKHIDWDSSFLSEEEFVLALGEYPAGKVTINLAKTPHFLIAAATGGGKTRLLTLIIWQSLQKGAKVSIADWKGVDYPLCMRKRCDYITNYDDLLKKLEEFQFEIEARKKLLVESESANILEFRQKTGISICRKILVLDETSMILDVTARSKEEKEVIAKVLSGLQTIGRIGRAYGITIIAATQRPSVESVPGALKGQLDGRICGHTADNISSIVVLDDSSAAKLPAIPGRFILRDVTGAEIIFQAYSFDLQKEMNMNRGG